MTGVRSLSLSLMLLVCILCPALAQVNVKMEAESANYANCQLITDSKYSGGRALELTKDNASITFNYNAAARGKNSVVVCCDALYGEKVVNLSVNGTTISFKAPANRVGEVEVATFIMNQGNNTIVVSPNWTWFRIDYIRIATPTSSVQFDISPSPADALATEAAKKVYTFLYDNFGKRTISGMMTGDMATANGNVIDQADVKAVYDVSGRYPALIGFDFIFATGRTEGEAWCKDYTNKVMALAKDTYRRGGLPAFTWHWHDPSRATDDFYTDQCSVKASSAMNANGTWNTQSTLYKNIVKDIHTIADYFLELQDMGVACLFRPLHEASGGWFWWGREGAVSFIKLYRLVYDQMVNVKGVHNVIWVWNAGEDDQAWNPGGDCYDIVSADIYNQTYDYSSSYASFDKLKLLTAGKKLIALSENGPIPDIDREFSEEAVWSWWMPWYQTWNGNFVNMTSRQEWTKCMSDPRVVTLEDLSDGWGTYTSSVAPVVADTIDNHFYYDLLGRMAGSHPKRGLYVRDGKKVVVK